MAVGGGTIANLQVTVGANVAGALLGFQTLEGAIGAVVGGIEQFVSSGIQMNSFLESSELQFKTLTGSASAAHAKVGELFDLAAHTPFTFESVTVAARQLEVFGGAALDTTENLRMLGDSAAATAAPIEQVTFWTGRMYSELQAGEPIGMAVMWLQRMGVLSAEAASQMKKLSDAGASGDEIWKAFTESQRRFGGAMKEQEGTWKGLTSTMSDTITLLTGEATHAGFVRLEGDIRKVNVALADPGGLQATQALGTAFDFLVQAGETAGSGFDKMLLEPIRNVSDAADALAHGSFLGLRSALLDITSDNERLATVMEAGVGRAAADLTEKSGALANAMHAGSEEGVRQIKVFDTLAGSYHTLADAEKQRLYEQGQLLANSAGNPTQEEIIFKARQQMQQNVADAEKRNAEQAARNQEEAMREQARVITEQNQETQRRIAEQTRAAQEAVRTAYVETADEAVAQYQRIANAAAPVVDTLQQQIDEATNAQVRAGTAGTADAEKQLDDIRKAHLKVLPDLVAIDRQYADAQQGARAADLAVAAAERDLKVALAASGGQQTLQTAALSHAVTAAQEAAAAAHDHEQALAAERSQAISDTNALKGLQAQREGMGGGGGDFKTLLDTGSQGRRTTIYGMPITQPTIVNTTNLHFNGNVTTTQADFQQSVVNAVQQADRQNALKLTRYATRI